MSIPRGDLDIPRRRSLSSQAAEANLIFPRYVAVDTVKRLPS